MKIKLSVIVNAFNSPFYFKMRFQVPLIHLANPNFFVNKDTGAITSPRNLNVVLLSFLNPQETEIGVSAYN